MRQAVGQVNELTDEHLQFTRQCGMADILMNTPKLTGEERWEYDALARLVEKADSFGVRLICIENVPNKFFDKIMLGLPGRDGQLANMHYTVRNMARAGIPILGYHWMPSHIWRSERAKPIRGGNPGDIQVRFAGLLTCWPVGASRLTPKRKNKRNETDSCDRSGCRGGAGRITLAGFARSGRHHERYRPLQAASSCQWGGGRRFRHHGGPG